MALFATQLARVAVNILSMTPTQLPLLALEAATDFVIVINQMINVIVMGSVHLRVYICFADNIYYLARASHQR